MINSTISYLSIRQALLFTGMLLLLSTILHAAELHYKLGIPINWRNKYIVLLVLTYSLGASIIIKYHQINLLFINNYILT